jgi:serine/threonine protein kinase
MTKPVHIKDEFLVQNKIFEKYYPLKKIDNGSFGNIYQVRRIADNKYFAMKTEKKNAPQQTLKSEANSLLNFQGGFGFPKFIGFGQTKHFNILIETLLDKSLYKLFIKKKNKCNINDVCLIGIQILHRLEWIHSKNYIYRDIKPENFLIGINDPNVIYIVDFGLCKKYRSSKTGKHISPRSTGKFNGTLIYASPNVVRGEESSRRDDLISLGYMLIYLFKRDLPWESSFKNLDQSKYFELIYLKETDGRNELFKNIPKEFIEYIKYTRKLKFEENPNYSYLRSLFNNCLSRINTNCKSLTFSWIHFQSKRPIGEPNTLKNNSSQYKSNKNIFKEKKFRLKNGQI